MWIEILLVLIAYWIYVDFIYPRVIYKRAARENGGSMPYIEASYPFGIPVTYKLVKSLFEEKMVNKVYEISLNIPSRTYLKEAPFEWQITTNDPENIKTILALKYKDYGMGRRLINLVPTFGSGIFTQDGLEWKHSRAMLRPQFTKEQISRLEHILQYTGDLVNSIDRQHGNVELVLLFHMLTMDTATEFLFGQSAESLKLSNVKGSTDDGSNLGSYVTNKDGKRIYASDFVESYDYLNDYCIKRICLNRLNFVQKFSQPEYKDHLNLVRGFIDFYVHEALEATAKYTIKGKDAEAELDARDDDEDDDDDYVFIYELAKETRDPLVIRDQCSNILIAGRDTTASTLCFAFYYFALYPETWKKCREEVLSLFSPEDDDEQITYESLRKLKYLQRFIKEVLRLHPVLPTNTRWAVKDTMLPRGGGPNGDEPVFVSEGMAVNFDVYVMHRDKDIYGPDAEEFNPERWNTENNKVRDSAMYSWGYIPFNGGPRICLGQQFALTELYLVIVKLAMNYRFIEKSPEFPTELRQKSSLTLVIGGNGLPVRMVR